MILGMDGPFHKAVVAIPRQNGSGNCCTGECRFCSDETKNLMVLTPRLMFLSMPSSVLTAFSACTGLNLPL